MSRLGKIFSSSKGKGKKNAAPSAGEAIQKLRDTEEMLIKKQEYLETKIGKELDIAKKNGTKDKRAALQALKRKKRYEAQLRQIDGTLSTIELQRENLESANTNTHVLQSMGEAARALKQSQAGMNVDSVHDLMDDIAEVQELSEEIAGAISNPIAFGQDIDDDDLLAELEDLEQEALDEKLLETGTNTAAQLNLPDAPREKIPAHRKKVAEDDDLDELAAWAS
ncbi:unnamed protein product [Meganyctiphanes norvegica]|uniref:Uncharacterized protein n=1 Tax=Meganyctiphanes norvegica TaxID=48144 RepID=A0AAV2RA25_MEGNR